MNEQILQPRRVIEIMDTTLRDGEQTHGVSLTPEEKFTMARTLIEKVKVDRVEVASACVSEGEKRSLKEIAQWAKKAELLSKIEVLGFCDVKRSADWIGEAGGKVMNLLTKGSFRHLKGQLRQTPAQHLKVIAETVDYCTRSGMTCNCYLEDWSNGMQEKDGYARWIIQELARLPIKRLMLADTLGVFSPEQVRKLVSELVEANPSVHFDFHCHNDYGVATANTLAAAQSGARGVHVTVNGLGERAGNAPLDEVAVALRDLSGLSCGINEKEMSAVSKMVEVFSGRRIAANKPITGLSVFTQTAGIHADGDKKDNLYVTKLSAERFGRKRTYALGKLSGKANLEMNLDQLGLELTDEQKRLVLERIVELGDQKRVTTATDLPFIIADILKSPQHKVIDIEDCVVVTTHSTKLSTAAVKIKCQDREYHASATGNGGYDAFMKALVLILKKLKISMPRLLDYEVHIPPGGNTDALVETTIAWDNGMHTRGVDSDQIRAAIMATEHMLNLHLNNKSHSLKPNHKTHK